MSSKKKYLPWLLCGIVGLFLGFTGYTFYYAKGISYFSNDPKACANCHIMRDHYDSWQKSSHHAVATCNDCHTPKRFISKYLAKFENGFWHSKGFTFQDFHEPIFIRSKNRKILERNCLHCHKDFIINILSSHHLERRSLNCLSCHDSVGHGPRR